MNIHNNIKLIYLGRERLHGKVWRALMGIYFTITKPHLSLLISTALLQSISFSSLIFISSQIIIMNMGKDMSVIPKAEMGRNVEEESGSPAMRTAETLLRVLPVVLCVVALVIMLKDSQTNDYGSLSYSDLGAFR